MIWINDQQYWLYDAVDPDTNRFLNFQLFTTTMTALTQQFLRELREKHGVSDTGYLVNHTHHLVPAWQQAGLRFQPEVHGNRNAVERIVREIKRRTS